MAARHQEALGIAASRSDEMIKAVVEGQIGALRASISVVEASVAQMQYEGNISAAAAAPVRAPPGYMCAPCGSNPCRAGAGTESSAPCGDHGAPQGPPGIGQRLVFPNGLCHCDHVIAHGQALTLLTTRVASGENTDKSVADEIQSLSARLQALELARAKFLQIGRAHV